MLTNNLFIYKYKNVSDKLYCIIFIGMDVCSDNFFVISFIIYTFFQYKYYVLNADKYPNWAVNQRRSQNLGDKNHWCQLMIKPRKNLIL